MVLAYTRISTDKQDQLNQEHLILTYCQHNNLIVDQFIKVEMSTRKSEELRKINELKERLEQGDTLIVSELSRLGRKMIDVLNLVKELGDNGVNVIFINQPELSVVTGAMKDFLITAYGYFLQRQSESSSHCVRKQIEQLLLMGQNVMAICKFINSSKCKDEYIKYTTLKYFIDTDESLQVISTQ